MKILLGGRQRAVSTRRPSREPFSFPLKAGAVFDNPRDGLVRHFYCQARSRAGAGEGCATSE
jgi:hypothetical protein